MMMSTTTVSAATMTEPAAFSSSSSNNKCKLIPDIDEKRRHLLEKHGVTIEPMEPLGARVTGLDLFGGVTEENQEVLEALEYEMASRGFLVFPNLGVMTPKQQIKASELWGGREIHSTHGVHPATPREGYPHIFRLSNNPREGTLGVGPQWHNDGSFVEGTFSHVGLHLVKVPENGGGTYIAHQGAAFDMLPPEKQERWSRLASINSNSGVLHPLVHKHPITGRKSIWLHLGMTGAVIEYLGEDKKAKGEVPYRLLNESEMKELFTDYNDILNNGVKDGYTVNYNYKEGDFVVIDNLAVSHKASPEAHTTYQKQGLRVLHRTTVKATQPLKPGFGLPQATDIYGPNPFGDDGVWIGGGIGYRFAEDLHYQN
jgi:taurine dioxygenase